MNAVMEQAPPRPVSRPATRPVSERPSMPREHGAWGILLVPFATAVGVAGTFNLPVVLLLVSVLCFYLARTSFLKQHWTWVVILLAASAGAAAPLMLKWHLWWLVGFGVVAAPLAFRKTERLLVLQLLAMTGLTSTAPAAWYVATGKLDAMAWLLWLLNSLYFAGSFVFVKMNIAAAIHRKPFADLAERFRFGALNLGYHAGLTGFLLVLGATRVVSWPVVAAFVPAVVRAVAGTVRLTPVLRIKQLAWMEVAYSILIGTALILAMRW